MIKNIIANWSNVIVSMLAVFILYPFFLRTLGEEQYGVWLLISSATGYFSLLQMGVPMANVRFISKHYAKQEFDELNEVVCTNLFFFAVGALLILLFGFGLAFLLDFFFDIPKEFVKIAKIATVLVCFEISIRFIFEVFEGFFHARQQFVAFNIVKNFMILVRVGLTFAIVRYENGLILVATVILAVTVVQSLLFFFYTRKLNPFLKFNYKFIKFKTFKKIFGYSVFILLLQLGMKISYQTDALVIGSVVSVSAVVWFNIGNNLLIYFMKFMSGISNALMPRISSMEAKDGVDGIDEIYCQYSRILMFLVLPVCLCFWCFGGDFIALWMGEKYRVLSGTVLSILTIGYLFYLVQAGVALPIMMGTSKVKYPTILMFCASLLNLILSIFLGENYGIYGVAWGTTIPNLIVVSAIIFYMCKIYKINILQYIFRSTLIPFISSFSFLFFYFFIINNVVADSYLILLALIISSTLIYLTTVFFLFLTNVEKKWLSDKVINLFN